MRTAFDFTPYRRSTVGFDRLFDALERSSRVDTQDGYPPFDIARTGEESYRITLAVAGFTRDEITAVVYHYLRRQPLSLSPTRARPAPSVSAVSGTENENRKEEKPLAA